jgi:micrococcal nuclease
MLRFLLLVTLAAGFAALVARELPPEEALSHLQSLASGAASGEGSVPLPTSRDSSLSLPASRDSSPNLPASREAVKHEEKPHLVALAPPVPICGNGRRISCVVDGDTFWLAGEKVRLEGIDAPEINGACAYERELAQKATRRLSEILSAERLELHRNGRDRYQRTLARVDTPRGEAGDILIREGLARPWKGRKEQWCS